MLSAASPAFTLTPAFNCRRPRAPPLIIMGSSSPRATKAARPKLVVFDLDATLWYPEMYMLWGAGGAPFRATPEGNVKDRSNTTVRLMGNSRKILLELADDKDVMVGVASSTDEPDWAQECMKKITVNADGRTMKSCIDIEAIQKGPKSAHFESLRMRSKIPFDQMVFFDNEMRNIRSVSPLGVTCVYTPDGMTPEKYDEGMREFAASATRSNSSR